MESIEQFPSEVANILEQLDQKWQRKECLRDPRTYRPLLQQLDDVLAQHPVLRPSKDSLREQSQVLQPNPLYVTLAGGVLIVGLSG